MKLSIIAIGNKMPGWVTTAFKEFEKRFPREFPLILTEIPATKRFSRLSNTRVKETEGEKILSCIQPRTLTIALDEQGTLWDTRTLVKQLDISRGKTAGMNFLIGGPDGLSANCLAKANLRWSLSPLTLPHPLVRIVLIEQLYRAISILQNHPYHRV